jgi:predicted metal-dependent hydrolase
MSIIADGMNKLKSDSMEIGGIEVEVLRKDIKNLHLSVRPPDGDVRVSAPRCMDDEAVRLALAAKLEWIRKKRRLFEESERQPEREMVSGESHYFRGRRYRLEVEERDGAPRVALAGERIRMSVRPGADLGARERALNDWYRRHVKDEIPALVGKWEPVMGVSVAEWGVKRMKTRWGSCNVGARRIWLNSELAKKPPRCLEYVLVHEMAHLLERGHGDRFKALMHRFLPSWRLRQAELEDFPLSQENW